jgi:neutral ceramidase
MLQAGFAQTAITPPIGVELTGFCFGKSEGIQDDLQAQALVLDNGRTRQVIVAADLLSFSADLADALRDEIAADLATTRDAVLLSASHTHSGPTIAPMRTWGQPDATYVACLHKQLRALAGAALRDIEPVTIGYGCGDVDSIGENRRGYPEVQDTAVPVIRIDAGDRIKTVLYNVGCHPVILHCYENQLSPDYPGFARRTIHDILGEDVGVMFTLGAAGDINPQFFDFGKTTLPPARKIGTILGCEVAKVALEIEPAECNALAAATVAVEMPLHPLPSEAELHAEIVDAQGHIDKYAPQVTEETYRCEPYGWMTGSQCSKAWAEDCLALIAAGQVASEMTIELQAMTIGPATLIIYPFETPTETIGDLRAALPEKNLVLCSNSNGTFGYIPRAEFFEGEDYINPQGSAHKFYGIYCVADTAEAFVRQAAEGLLARLT